MFANVDLFGGVARDREACKRLIRQYFPRAIITSPQRSVFGRAVKNLWALPQSEYFLHIEDDWVCHRDISPLNIVHFLADSQQ